MKQNRMNKTELYFVRNGVFPRKSRKNRKAIVLSGQLIKSEQEALTFYVAADLIV